MSNDLNLESFWAEMNDGITPQSIIDSIYTLGHKGETLVRGFSPIRLLLVWEPFYWRKFHSEKYVFNQAEENLSWKRLFLGVLSQVV